MQGSKSAARQGRWGVEHKHVASPHKEKWGSSTVIDEADKPICPGKATRFTLPEMAAIATPTSKATASVGLCAAAAHEPCRRRLPDRSKQQTPLDAENLDSSQSAGTVMQWQSEEEAASTHFEGRENIMNEEQCMLNSQVSWEREDLKFGSVRFFIYVWK